MKNQFERSRLDDELSNLKKDIVWKNANNNQLKHNLVRDINKLTFKTKCSKIFGISTRISAVASVFVIAFILVKLVESNVNQPLRGSNPNAINTNEPQFDGNKNITVHFTEEEQELTKMVDGIQSLVVTEEAVIPSNVQIFISSIIGEPKISATKANNRVLVSVDYPVKGDKELSIGTAINKQGSAKLAYDSLVKKYNTRTELSIGNHKAILLNSHVADEKQQLILVSEEFIYYISGGQSSDEQIQLAELINFIKE